MADAVEQIEALGPVSIPVRKLVELIAASPSFQARVKVTTATDAFGFIHHPELRVSSLDEITGPLAVVGTERFGLASVEPRFLRPSDCSLMMILSDDDRYPERADLSQIDFENFVGLVMADIALAQGEDTNLTIESMELIETCKSGPEVQGVDKRKAYWIAPIVVKWSRL